MDPNDTLMDLLKLLLALRVDPEDKSIREESRALLADLCMWLRQGGFPPDVETICGNFVDALNHPGR